MANRWFQNSTFWGLFITLGGVALLIQNLFDIPTGGVFWGAAFLVAGAAFIKQAFDYDRPWWPFIPGVTLLGMSISAFLSVVLPEQGFLQGAFTLGGVAVAFVLVYLRDKANWWAIIPSGVLTTLAVISTLEEIDSSLPTEPLFFVGVGLTFLVLAVLPGHQLSWAYIPALALLVVGSLFGFLAAPASNLIWAIVLIATGILLVLKSLIRSKSQ